ncbi:hypothetical protein [Mycolicibacterium chlorophenolicum]|uniref:Uncharacterized protein n=1 Tax=Mycolicibacterium chlorophenolicum TaxID=37916 RepID=A0A0J6YA70_9MYCO|nr:hypothetical protein [Mycolicibacterium chlorophenolicum]KMO69831.1 hypothetical protein MCHLDSM_05943 [Mycolicibacterium chlorophenolicum]
MDITNAGIHRTVEAADHSWMIEHCPTYHSGVSHGLIIDVDDRYADAIVVQWIGPDGLQNITYQLPSQVLVESAKPAPPFTVQIRRRLTDGHYYSDEPDGSYFTATEALFWLTSWSRLAQAAYGATQAPDLDSSIPGAFTVTRPCGEYTETRYLAALPTT